MSGMIATRVADLERAVALLYLGNAEQSAEEKYWLRRYVHTLLTGEELDNAHQEMRKPKSQ